MQLRVVLGASQVGLMAKDDLESRLVFSFLGWFPVIALLRKSVGKAAASYSLLSGLVAFYC